MGVGEVAQGNPSVDLVKEVRMAGAEGEICP